MSEQHPSAAHRRNVAERDGWTAVSCLVADIIRGSEYVKPMSSKTDLDGHYGEPEVYTEWATDGRNEVAVLREHRWPSPHSGHGDRYACEHYAPTTNPEPTRAESEAK